MLWKLLFAAAGIGEVASERNNVEGGALLQRTVGVHKIGQTLADIDCKSDTLLKKIADAIVKHDELMLSGGDSPADFDGLVTASKGVDTTGERFGKSLRMYFVDLYQAANMCPEEAPKEDVDAVCAINGLLSGLQEHFHKVEPTFGKSPLAICAQLQLMDVKEDVAMWLKSVRGEKRKGRPERGERPEGRPEGGERPEGRPEGGERPEGPPEGRERPEGPPEEVAMWLKSVRGEKGEDCVGLWDKLFEAAQEANAAFDEMVANVLKHGEALANAGDLNAATPEELRHVCEVGLGMAYVRGIAAVLSPA